MQHTFWTDGKCGTAVAFDIVIYPNGTLVISAEDEHFTEYGFLNAAQKKHPDYKIVALGSRDGFWYARGGKVK